MGPFLGLPPPWGPVGPPCPGELQPPPGMEPSLGLRPLGICSPLLGLGPPWGAAAPQVWGHPWDQGHPGELQPPPGWDHPWDHPPWGPPPLPGLGPSLGSALGICSLPGTGANHRLGMPLGICAPSQAWNLPGDWGLQGSAPSETPWESRSPPMPPWGGLPGCRTPAPTPLWSSGGAMAAARAFGVSWCGRGPAGRGAQSLVPPWASRC